MSCYCSVFFFFFFSLHSFSFIRIKSFTISRGDFGRLGHGNSSDLFTPQPIKALHGIKIRQIACGDSHCLAVTMEGEVQRLVVLYKTLSRSPHSPRSLNSIFKMVT